MSILRLAIPTPLRAQFDYLPPADITPEQLFRLKPGCRVSVPFGRREITGYVLAIVDETQVPSHKLRAALQILDDFPLISTQMLEMCQWAANYYHHPIGEVMACALPATLRRGMAHKSLGRAGWRLTTHGKGLPKGALQRSPKQARALDLLQESGEIDMATLTSEGITPAVMRSLLTKSLVEHCTLARADYPAKSHPGLKLNTEQSVVVNAIKATLGGFACHLLEGVTGSGKTEVYLQLIARVLEQKGQVLVLIPEIGLTPQTSRRFEERFQANIINLHSGLSEGARYEGWEAARDGSAHIIIGTRSSVFAPLNKLGLVIVDEEHDSSYKQQDGFRYSARDIAVKRAQQANCPILLGSATPSLESIYNVQQGRYQHHLLAQRAGGAQLPKIATIDIRKQALTAGFSPALLDAVADTLNRGKQVLLFLNRRGFAPTLQCHDCGWLAECRNCDARLTVHRAQGVLRCHHCTASLALPRACPHCHGRALITSGIGTQQADEFLRGRFPGVLLHRVDSDSMRGKDAMSNLVTQMQKATPCILLGTQMLTKGHHFPGVNLVAVIDADAALFSADFRGEERMAQLLTQVAGRAGRAGEPGKVLLQTHYPDHPILQSILTKSYADHARTILAARLALGMPPASSMALIRTDAKEAVKGELFLEKLRQVSTPALPAGATLIGPLPAPMQRRAGLFRSQLMLMATSRRDVQIAARTLVSAADRLPTGGLKWTIDIDPQEGM